MRLNAGHFLVGFVIAAFVSIVTGFLIGLHPFAEGDSQPRMLLRACNEMLTGTETRAIVATALVLALAAGHAVVAMTTLRRSRRKLRELTVAMDYAHRTSPGGPLKRIAEELHIAESLQLVEFEEPFAITAGVKQPRIYLSTGAIDALDTQELETVLLHEKHHLVSGDAARIELIAVLRSTFGYLPGLRRLTDRFVRSREFAADDAAVAESRHPASLLTAFIKLHPAQWSASATAGYSNYATLRVRRLMGMEANVPPSLADVSSIVTTLTFPTLLPALALLLTEPHVWALLLRH